MNYEFHYSLTKIRSFYVKIQFVGYQETEVLLSRIRIFYVKSSISSYQKLGIKFLISRSGIFMSIIQIFDIKK
jgi:hypothetical protein